MNVNLNALRAQLASRIRQVPPPEWGRFSTLWIAFNALYGGEPDRKERSRVTACIRRNLKERHALQVLRTVSRPIGRILAIPPGNLLMDATDPSFRAASHRYAAIYQNRSETAVNRLAAVGAVLYQIRCNLIHGGKSPDDQRDTMLVRESVAVLEIVVPAIENALVP